MHTYHSLAIIALVFITSCVQTSPTSPPEAPEPIHVVRATHESSLAELAACCGSAAGEYADPCLSYECGYSGECVEIEAPYGEVCEGDPAFPEHGRCIVGGKCLVQIWPDPVGDSAVWARTSTPCDDGDPCPAYECKVAICSAARVCLYAALPASEPCGSGGSCSGAGACVDH